MTSILYIALGFAMAYFAAQNTTPVTIALATAKWENIPLYLVMLISFFLGLVVGIIIKLLQGIPYGLVMNKTKKIIDLKDEEITALNKDKHELQIKLNEMEKETGKRKIKDDLSI